jgi:hypothetical protein
MFLRRTKSRVWSSKVAMHFDWKGYTRHRHSGCVYVENMAAFFQHSTAWDASGNTVLPCRRRKVVIYICLMKRRLVMNNKI